MGNRAAKSSPANTTGEEISTNSQMSEASSSSNAETRSNPSYYTMIKNSYQQLVNAIIRPPRNNYEDSQLGPADFVFCGKKFHRTDFTLMNERNLCFVCSMWEPVAEDRPSAILPCVIYMHGNSSSRLEALSTLSVVLAMGATLFAFDFCGSGKSQGEYVSLGAFEKEDLQRVVEYLRCTGTTSTIALWGRSMGAATALLHGERDPSIASMVLDSAFADLVMLAEEMVEKGRQQGFFAPNMLVRVVIQFIRSSVQKQAGFDIKVLSPIAHADRCFIPALFVAAEGDNFVLPTHSKKIYDKYGGDKNLVLVEGDHNTPRPKYLYDSIAIFLQNTLQIPNDWILPEGQQYVRRLPWTYRGNHTYHQQAANIDTSQGLSLDQLVALSLMEQDGVNPADYLEDYGSTPHGSHSMVDEHGDVLGQGSLADELVMQRDVQESLYSLLSGGGTTTSTSTTTAVNSSTGASSTGSTGTGTGTVASSSTLRSRSMSSSMDSRSGSVRENGSSIYTADMNAPIGGARQSSADGNETTTTRRHCWTCETCTLDNPIDLLQCDACGVFKPSVF